LLSSTPRRRRLEIDDHRAGLADSTFADVHAPGRRQPAACPQARPRSIDSSPAPLPMHKQPMPGPSIDSRTGAQTSWRAACRT
jgi:hypothetical protein